MTISIEYAQSELIKAYKNYHTTMNASYANNKLGTIFWDANGNPFQITRLQYCQQEIDKCQKTLDALHLRQWSEMFIPEEAA